jgi:glycine cleavage system aminomethyltransferase T
MRVSPVRELLADRGASFRVEAGVERVSTFTSFEEEYLTVRNAVGLTDLSFTARYTIPEEGLDVFDRYATGSVANIRFGRMLHTMAVDEAGYLEGDLYIANDDERFILIAEALVEDADVARALRDLGGADAGLEDISESTALFALDGVNAWAVVKDLLGPDILGLPYLSVETYELAGVDIKLFRSGKTSEFGYMLLVPAEAADTVWKRIEEAGKPHGLGLVGFDTHMGLRLDGRFFNIHGEGKTVRDPLPLGLQWMMDLEGEEYRGREALMRRRAEGVKKKIIGVATPSRDEILKVGTPVVHDGRTIGKVMTVTDSPTLERWLGLALLEWDYAYANLDFTDDRGRRISTISMPPFAAKSLAIRLDEM